MIRAHRVNATAQDDASPISGWNVAPNVAYSVTLAPGLSGCGVFLFAEDEALVASGAALVGTEQPCVLIPQSGQVIGMIDAELGWHLLLTTIGTEPQRTVRINPAVDLPDEIHPVYGDDDLALVRATAGIDGAAHYIDDLTASCPLGLGAGLGDVASVPVDGVAVVGQVESITWIGTPNGASEQAVVRRHVAIAPAPAVLPPAPPVVVNDAGETTADETTSGNVLTNDATGLTIVAVNGLAVNVGGSVAGSAGGVFTVASNGVWSFDPSGDFDLLTSSETATTSVMYYASDGVGEASATLTITVSAAVPIAPVDPHWSSVLVLVQAPATESSIVDAKGHTVNLSGHTSVSSALGSPSIFFDGSGDLARIPYTSDLAWGSGDWTVEFLFYPTSTSSGTLFCDAVSAGGYYAMRVLFGGGTINVYMYDSSNTEFLVGCGAISVNTFNHFAVQRSGGTTLSMYKNGVFVTSRSIVSGRAMKAMSAPYTLGGYVTTDYYSGHILAFRKTNGLARYTANFTPPTWPLPTL